jgi:subtilisin family serine protease
MDEAYIYNDETWTELRDDGAVEIGFRIWRRTNDEPYAPESEWGPAVVDASVAGALAGTITSDDVVFLDLRLRNFPEWDLPLLGTPHSMAAQDYAAIADQREEMMQERAELLNEMSADLRTAVEEAGGTIHAMSASGGWVSVELPASAFGILESRTDVAVISRADGEVQQQIGPPHWKQGESGWTRRTDGATLVSQGFDGDQANPGRHGYGRIVVALIEQFAFEDDACAFMDSANCSSSRILGRYACDDPSGNGGDYCEFVANWNDESELGDITHGTKSAAAALGDYTDDQGCGYGLNDPAWTSGCHSAAWEQAASGMAPEAYLLYYGKWKVGLEFTSIAASIDKAALQDADIISMSLGVEANQCDAEAVNIIETAAENAFDDGALVIAAAGNVSGPTSACNVLSPGDLTKTLTVNAYDACQKSGTNCTSSCQDSPYLWCLIDQSNSARGGDSVTLSGGGSGSLSLIDLLGPNRFYYQTDARGLNGWVIDGSDTSEDTANGTSIATPLIAGLAALMKDFYVSKGVPWVNFPGAMHTVMLAVGDRHYSTNPTSTSTSTIQRTTGASDLYGLGRAKVRWLEESGTGSLGLVRTKMQEVTFGSGSPDSSFLAWGTPLPSGIDFLKCVMLQMEDTSETATHSFSDIDLSVKLRTPSGTFCSLQDSLSSTTTDTSHDVKSMVAIEGSTLSGKCVEVLLDKVSVPAAGITTRTFCYVSSTADDEPQ